MKIAILKTWEEKALAALWLLAVLFLVGVVLAGCGDCARVVAEVTVSLDGGQAVATPNGATYCATECEKTADCPAGFHCSLPSNPPTQQLCYLDYAAVTP